VIDNIVKHILGEAKGEEEPDDKPKPEATVPDAEPGPGRVGAPEDSEIDELANMWTTGNKENVVNRFIEMDNETAVKVVFAIGREAALELARMVDMKLEQSQDPDQEDMLAWNPPEQYEEPGGSTEPAATVPPPTDYPSEILGRPT